MAAVGLQTICVRLAAAQQEVQHTANTVSAIRYGCPLYRKAYRVEYHLVFTDVPLYTIIPT